jgi:hypothetical protein
VQPGNTANTTPWLFDVNKVGGTATVNGGLAGTLAVGGTQANNAAITANPELEGGEVVAIGTAGTQAAAATAGNARRIAVSQDGALFIRNHGPVIFSAGFNSIAATLTQVQAAPAAGLSIYITDISIQTTTVTSGTYAFQAGTGSNCGTGTAAIYPSSGTAKPIQRSDLQQRDGYHPIHDPAEAHSCKRALCDRRGHQHRQRAGERVHRSMSFAIAGAGGVFGALVGGALYVRARQRARQRALELSRQREAEHFEAELARHLAEHAAHVETHPVPYRASQHELAVHSRLERAYAEAERKLPHDAQARIRHALKAKP